MGLLAKEKRELAEKCILLALNQDFEKSAKIRQEAYAINPPGSIGVDWKNWSDIWKKDFRYITFMLSEDYSDCNNTKSKIEAIHAGIFVDYLFDFRDCWGVKKQAELSKECFCSELLEKFLIKEKWNFVSANRELIYTSTKKQNIEAKVYYESIKNTGLRDVAHPKIYANGEYYLGFLPGTPQKIIDGRRKWLEMHDLFLSMSASGIEKFPKTYQTFEKHALANSEKYREWMKQYLILNQAKRG